MYCQKNIPALRAGGAGVLTPYYGSERVNRITVLPTQDLLVWTDWWLSGGCEALTEEGSEGHATCREVWHGGR